MYYKFKDINSFLEEQINSIEKTHDLYTCTFPKSERAILIEHLNKYIKYFKKHSDEDGNIDYNDILKLYK